MSATIVVQLKNTHTPPSVRLAGKALPATIETLFHEHKAMIFRAAYRITGSASEAEDALQTIFLRLMQHEHLSERDAHDFSEGKLSGAYMHRAAINCALDIVRKRRLAPSLTLDEAPLPTNSNSHNPESALEERELRCLLQKAVARLHPKSAEVFVLRYFEGKTNGEIAELLQTSALVVAVMLHRARTRLRSEISEFLEKHHEQK